MIAIERKEATHPTKGSEAWKREQKTWDLQYNIAVKLNKHLEVSLSELLAEEILVLCLDTFDLLDLRLKKK